MRIDLKCGEYLDFYKIIRVEILEHEIIKIKGSLEKGKKSVTHQTRLQTIKNIREFNRFLKKEMKLFQADGACEYCGSINLVEIGKAPYFKKLNEPKEKYRYKEHLIDAYRCNACKKLFAELKPIDLEIYYK